MSTTKDKRFRTYFEVRNVDAGDGEMYLEGVSDTGLPNRRGMLLDYETSRPHIVAFVKEFEDRTGGASKGPLRIMHDEDASAAAGKIVNLDLNDDDKTIPVRVHVVDEVAKTKVSASVLNAFSWFWRSVGAPWKDAELTAKHGKPIYRFTGRPVELSLVDSPGVPGTGFTIENADFGLEEDDMDEKDESTKPEGGEEIKNGVYTAGRLMSLLEGLTYVQTAIASEESKEGDSNEIPEELRDAIKALAPVVTKYAAEQIAELVGGEDEDMFVSDDDEFSDIANVADDEGDEIANLDAILNGDYPGHPFRGNQYAKGKGGGRKGAGGAHHQASKMAHRASVAASSGKSGHNVAAKSHKAAAALHEAKGNKRMVAHHKAQEKFHRGESKLRAKAATFQNSDGGDDAGVKNSDSGTSAEILAALAAEVTPIVDVKNADKPDATILVTKDEDAGIEVKNVDTIRAEGIRAEAVRIAALPEGEQAAAIAARIFKGIAG